MTEHEQMWREEYAKMLKKLMRRKNISIRQLADMLGMARSTVGQYVSGECLPNVYVAQKIKEILTQ